MRKIEKKVEECNLNVTFNSYDDFFQSKDNKKMVLYDDFPSLEMIINYYYDKSWLAEHPIFEYGKFDIKELAILIKLLCSFYYGKNYEILTFGGLEKIQISLSEGVFDELVPRLFFLIGTKQALSEYREYKNSFLGSEQSFNLDVKIPDLMVLQPHDAYLSDTLGVGCYDLCGRSMWYSGGIYYYDYLKDEYFNKKYLSMTNIFDLYFVKKIDNYEGIQDTLSIPIHRENAIIGKLLISIAIYKKNHQKVSLSNEDYQRLFYELFQDNSVQMKKLLDKNIPKTLKYVKKD